MKFSIVFCHFKTGKMSAYTVAQLLKFKGKHELEILICDNNAGDGSTVYLEPFKKEITIIDYPKDRMQSHGIGYNLLFELATNEWIICLESDAFPVKEGWLDYYVRLINEGYDCAGSLLKLSGGTYLHPAGALYRRSIFVEAFQYCKEIPYYYFPNFAMSEGFACHTMIHKAIVNIVLANPDDYVELADGYKPYTPQLAERKCVEYMPTCGPFHNGMGLNNESVKTYGFRNPETEQFNILTNYKRLGSELYDIPLPNKSIIKRVGFEPGQWMYYWQLARDKNIFHIPTETKWIEGKSDQQQEYTLTESGVKHLWGISAYHDYYAGDKTITEIKQSIPDKLYNTLPPHLKIK